MRKYRRMLPHVAALIAIGLGVLEASPLAAAADRAARFCTSCDIACAPGHNHAVQLARRWQPVVEWRFDRDLGNWQIKNYQKALKIEIADDAAWGRSLFVHRDDKEIDPAFELTSPPIPVAEGTLCRLTIAAAHTLDLSMARGHKESCQNLILLGRMVEKASGERLDAFCRSRIFQPLGMRDTSFGPLPPSSRVVPSGASEIGQIEDAQARLAGRPVGNAGLFSTAADLARFCEMMLGAGRLGEIRVLSPESHRLMTRNLLAPPLPARGFGWELDVNALHRPTRLSKRAYGHSGHTGQSLWIDPEKQVYVIVLTNRNHPRFVGGARKDEQYRARARIGDAALASLGY